MKCEETGTYLLEVGLKMRPVVVTRQELLIARGTLEGLFTSVDLLVSLKVGDLINISLRACKWQYLSEGFIAAWVVALVGLLSGMDSKVLLQRGVLSKRLSTSDGRTKE